MISCFTFRLVHVNFMEDIMYYDAHSHSGGLDLFNLNTKDYPVSSDLYLFTQLIQKRGVSGAFVFPMPTSLYYNYSDYIANKLFIPSGLCDFPFELENMQLLVEKEIITNVQIMPFMAFSIKDKIAEQIGFLEFNKKNIFGLKYHGLAEQSSIKNLKVYGKDFLNFAQDMGIPLLLHTGITEYDNSEEVFDLIKSFKHLKVIAAHLGGFKKAFFSELLNYDNVYFDMSPFLHNCRMMESIEKGYQKIDLDYSDPLKVFSYFYSIYGEKMLWGSDYPMLSKMNNGKLYGTIDEYEFFDNLAPDIKEHIGNRNFSDLIKKGI